MSKKPAKINWNIGDDDMTTINRIVMRLERIMKQNGGLRVWYNRTDMTMDIVACHLNCMPLKLEDLLNRFDDVQFVQDVVGISGHINRETAQLENHFQPRCAA